MNQIHATLEQAQRLQKAGFNKKCAFHCTVTSTRINTFYKDASINSGSNDISLPSTKKTYLPTLGEIDLPECVCVIKRPSGTYHIYTSDDLELDTPAPLSVFVAYETELEARIEAYLWVKANLPATE